MPSINLAGGPHGTMVRFAGTADEERYEPYPPGRALTVLQHAMRIIERNIYKHNVQCNRYFSHLPGGRTFDNIWEDASIWISLDPRPIKAFFGATDDTNKNITIYAQTFHIGHWWAAGTLIHELAHAAGAPGGRSIQAERALKFCGLGALFDPGAVGIYPRHTEKVYQEEVADRSISTGNSESFRHRSG
jgi:hypothetical protein